MDEKSVAWQYVQMVDQIKSLDALRSIYGEPKAASIDKQLNAIDRHCRRFIENSPFLVLGTVGDVSPKGDHPGFVKVLDEKTLVIPDRTGNNRLDSLQNVIIDSRVALIFFIPGYNETLRVNGQGEISKDPELLNAMHANGKLPHTLLIVHVEEAYLHCAKALLRSKLWDNESRDQDDELPPGSTIIANHCKKDPTEYTDYYQNAMDKMVEDEGHK